MHCLGAVGNGVVWCGVVWCGVVWCGVVWCGVVWCGVVWCGVVWCGVVWCGVVWCGVVWCGVVWCGVVWCGVVWCGCRLVVGSVPLGNGLLQVPQKPVIVPQEINAPVVPVAAVEMLAPLRVTGEQGLHVLKPLILGLEPPAARKQLPQRGLHRGPRRAHLRVPAEHQPPVAQAPVDGPGVVPVHAAVVRGPAPPPGRAADPAPGLPPVAAELVGDVRRGRALALKQELRWQ